MSDSEQLPRVSVVVATRNREELLAQSLGAILAQTYAGHIEVIVVYDRSEPVPAHELDRGNRVVRVMTNQRQAGLAGARNSGITASSGALVAFCDDDDLWRPEKLARQLDSMQAAGAAASVTGIAVHYEGITIERVPDVADITVELLTSSRLTGSHPSSYLMTRRLVDEVGLVDESIPSGYGEDYDWLMRLTAVQPVHVVREPLVDVLWHRGSFFTSRWDAMVASVDYLLQKYPALRQDPVGLGRLEGQRAFALVAQGKRSAAARAARRAFRSNPREPRVYVTALVASGLVTAPWVMHQANKRGRGI